MQNNCRFKINIITLLIAMLLISSISYAQQHDQVKVYYKQEKPGQFKFYASNYSYAPYQIKVSFKRLKNMNLSLKLPYYNIIESQTKEQYLFTATAQEGQNYRFKYQYQYSIGDPRETASNDYKYLLPYQHGEKHKVTQGYNGSYSHQNTLALDFAMDRGTPVTAARGGKVVKVKENSSIGGASKVYNNYANYITIYHQDGTFAKYVHLKYKGAKVKEGEQVSAGDVIGYSGNTGWSQGPHLHFEVFKAVKMGAQTIATNFLNYKQQSINLKEGKYYYSYHPGQGSINVQLGSKLNNQDYEGYSKSVLHTKQLTLEPKNIDETVVLFIKNGYDQKLEVKISFKRAINITTSKEIPFSMVVPETTKVYAFLIKPQNYQKPWDYSIEYSYQLPSKTK